MALADTARLIASLELQDKFSGPLGRAEGALGRVERQSSTLGRIGSETGRGLGNLARNTAVAGVAAAGVLAGLVTKSIEDASQLEQTSGAIESVFETRSAQIAEFARGAAQSTGLSQRAVQEMGAVIGAQLQGMGFAEDEAAEKTIELTKRAADMAATFGGTTADAIQAVSSLMRGERDPIERYGVSIKAADVNARILALGLDTSTTAAKKNAEAVAGLDLLMSATAATSGQFARESDTLAGTQQRLSANFENVRASLGTALLPSISRVAERMNQALTDNMPAIQSFAATLPGIFDQLLTIVENLPWGAIRSAFEVMGTGAQAALSAFAGAPPWLQTAVLTGWGLNKLTGGALGNIVGALGSGLIKGILGMNAGVVNINAATVNGGPGGLPGAAGRGGGFLGGLGRGLATGAVVAGGAALAGAAAVEVVNFETMRNDQRERLQGILDELPKTPARIDESIARIQAQINMERPLLEGVLFNTNVKPQLERQLTQLQQVKAAQERGVQAARDAIPWAQRNLAAVNAFNASEGTRFANLGSKQDGIANAVKGQGGILAQIRDKKSTFNLNATIPVSVNISAVQVAYNLQSLRQTINGGGFI